MQKTMQAIVKAKPEPGLWLEQVPIPEVGPDDVLIRTKKASICGTDIHIYNWDAWAQKTIPVPMTIGHEFVGEIASVGTNVRGFAQGDLVVGEGHITCGHCRNCLAGRRHLCPNTLCVGVNRPGAWAEFVSIPASNTWHADPSILLDVLSCFDPLGNAVHTALTFDLVGEDVLITGAGPIGCMAVPICKHAGARHVVIHSLRLQGIYGREMFETWYKMTSLIQSGVDISPVITHRFPFQQFKEAIELAKSGNSGKIVLDWSETASN